MLVLSASDQDADVMDAIMAGACGYLLKDSSINELLAGHPRRRERRVADLAGDRLEGAPARPRRAARRRRRSRRAAALRPRDAGAAAVANGNDNAQIAAELHISPKTVKNHISNILMKLQIENRIQAAVFAVRSGLA